jgi:hypothetical protein
MVLGPVITNDVKSSLMEHMSSLTLLRVKPHVPEETVLGAVQYVMFSLEEEPHVVMTNVQHTPNPSAQLPELDPPLSEHSALV